MGTAALTQAVGLSLALGAFLAGLHHQRVGLRPRDAGPPAVAPRRLRGLLLRDDRRPARSRRARGPSRPAGARGRPRGDRQARHPDHDHAGSSATRPRWRSWSASAWPRSVSSRSFSSRWRGAPATWARRVQRHPGRLAPDDLDQRGPRARGDQVGRPRGACGVSRRRLARAGEPAARPRRALWLRPGGQRGGRGAGDLPAPLRRARDGSRHHRARCGREGVPALFGNAGQRADPRDGRRRARGARDHHPARGASRPAGRAAPCGSSIRGCRCSPARTSARPVRRSAPRALPR